MSAESFFRGRSGRWLISLAALALAVVVFYLIFGGKGTPKSAGADAFSRSALGHEAFVRFLTDDPELNVLISRFHSEERVQAGQALVILEPPPDEQGGAELGALIAKALQRGAHVVVVLPKWNGQEGSRPGWVEQVSLRPTKQVSRVLIAALQAAALGVDATQELGSASIRRLPESSEPWPGEAPHDLSLELPRAQLIHRESSSTAPWNNHWHTEAGSLLVSAGNEDRLWILSDPDLLNTAGLGRGDNAAAISALFKEVLAVRAIVLDETIHGYERRPSPWRALLSMPLLPMTLHAFLLLVLMLWTATQRFGKPLPMPSRLPPGKRTLLDNTAELLGLADHRSESLRAYFKLTVRRTAEAMGLRVPQDSRISRLDRLAELRGSKRRLEPLGRTIEELPESFEAQTALRLAQELHAFRKELSNDGR